jgi:hypothetical protein
MLDDDTDVASLFAFLDKYDRGDGGRAEADERTAPSKFRTQQQHLDHEWNPATCISVPGTTFGIGYRCTCAHGDAARRANVSGAGGEVGGGEGGEGGEGAVLRIAGVDPRVLQKVSGVDIVVMFVDVDGNASMSHVIHV